MEGLIPSFGNAAFTIVAFVVALSIIVAVHEYGHYIVGRWTGIRAEVFSVGFGPVLFARTDRHGTRWQVAALPFGGYVKFLGDANAASVGGAEDRVPASERRHTMMGAPLWARSLTVAAGPVANFLLSILLFLALFLSQGRPSEPLTVASLTPLPPAYGAGLQPGDELLAVAGQPLTEGGGLAVDGATFPPEPVVEWTVRRNGQETVVPGPHPIPSLVGGVNPNSAAWDAGLQSGDVVTAVDGRPVVAFDQLVEAVTASAGAPLVLTVWRAGETLEFTLLPRRTDLPRPEGGFETRWLIGLTAGNVFTPVTESPGLLAALGAAVERLWFIITSSLSGIAHMISGAISTCNLSGPVGIAETSGAMASQGIVAFLSFVAVLSTAVGLMNLFPIPILDGGHLVFHAWEAVTGRPPGDRALRLLMTAGLAAILTLMVFAIANDLFLCP
jgi:regulator of sigma E protease